MHYRNLVGYFILPAMIAAVTIAAGAHREPTEERVPPSAMKEALSYKAPLERRAQPRQKSYPRVKGSTKAKGGVRSVTGSAAKATGLLRI